MGTDWEETYDQAHARVCFEAGHGVCVFGSEGMGWDGRFFATTTATTTTVLLLLQISTETVQKDSSDILSKKEKKKTGGCRLFGSHL